MAAKDDWLPRNHTRLIALVKIIVSYLNDPYNQVRMGFTGVNLDFYLNEFMPKYNALIVIYTIWEDPAKRTSVTTAELFTAENEFVPVCRKLYMGYLKNNPNVSNADLESMNLPRRNTERRLTPIPEDTIIAKADTSVLRRVSIYFRTSVRKNAAKPKGVHSAEIKWIVSNVPITDREDIHNTTICTRSPLTLEFSDKERGSYLYFIVRWENTRGEKGAWSEIYNAIIP
jgi:hypothetical protein